MALQLAAKLNGAIINADSVQIFKHADIGSAKPTQLEMAQVPHLLFSELEPNERIDAAKFAKLADSAIESAFNLGLTPIFAGGTGLYLKSLLHGLMDLPDKSGSKIQDQIPPLTSLSELYSFLKEIDPETAERLAPTDEVRIRRAIEIHRRTATSVAGLRDRHAFKELRYSALVLVCSPDRASLYESINQRTGSMLDQGILQEVQDLLLRYGEQSQVFKAIGYKEALAVIKGEMTTANFVSEVAKNTRRLAKRQYTWWKNEPAKLGWSEVSNEPGPSNDLLKSLSTFLAAEGALAEDRIYVRFCATPVI